jgi:hypothetical protein
MGALTQQTLETQFAESEAAAAEAAAELRALVVGALARVNAPPALQMFVAAVWRHTASGSARWPQDTGGSARWWHVTHRELCGLDVASASHIDPLTEVIRCSESTIKRVTARARDLGLIRVRVANSRPFPDGGPRERQPGESLEYQLDVDGIRAVLGLRPARCQIDPCTCQSDTYTGQIDTSTCQSDTLKNAHIGNKPVPVPDRSFPERIPYRNGTGTGAQPAPTSRVLDSLSVATLRDTTALLDALESVCEVSPIQGLSDCEDDRLWWVTAAEYSLRTGRTPVGLFRHLVQGNRRTIPRLVDEDAARRRLKEVERVECG